MVDRGVFGAVEKVPLCEHAQEEFEVFCAMPLVPLAQLYGGKLCAALDRQHPRDLFDVKLLLDHEGLTDEIKGGLVFALISSNRPAHELLDPNLQDQRAAFDYQFAGMSAIAFSYDDYEATRLTLIESVKAALNEDDKAFLLGFNRLEPDWSIYAYQDFPSVKWKLLNLETFKRDNPEAYQQQLRALEGIF